MTIPQFGEPQPGLAYPDRPAAFVIAVRDGRVACVRVSLPGGAVRLDLPGGGVDPGETPAQAGARECGEEAGLRVRVGEEVVRADHFFINEGGKPNNTRGVFLAAAVEGEDPALKVEDDHELIWLTPIEALKTLSRESHAWAIAAWLRQGRGG